MRRGIVLSGLLLALLAAPAAAEPTAPLGHQGRWLTDADGRVVILHGFNVVSKSPPYEPGAFGFNTDDAEFLAREGFNTVRLGVIYDGLEPERGVWHGDYLERLAGTERELARHGIFTVLDMHQDLYGRRYGGDGFPEWATLDDGLPREPNPGVPFGYVTTPALQRAFDSFWANRDGIQDAYADAWRRVAQRFRDQQHVAGYDIFNTPWPGSRWPDCASFVGCPDFDADELTSFSKRVAGRIRMEDSRTLVFYEPTAMFDYGTATHHGDIGDSRAGFSFHSHCLSSASRGASAAEAAATCPVNSDQVFENAEIQSEATGDALLLSDFGTRGLLPELEILLDTADRFMVSWQNWAYASQAPGSNGYNDEVESLLIDPSKPPTPDNVRQDLLERLVRPYPRATAGTPESFGFDRNTREFRLAYRVERPDGSRIRAGLETEVFMPERHYPAGYVVTVRGANVVSDPDARVLRLIAQPGAKQVTLKANPANRPAGHDPAGCLDAIAPRVTIAKRALRLSRRGLRVRGRARDTGCGQLAAVQVALSRRVGRRCVHLDARRRFGGVRSCRTRAWMRARGGASWRFRRQLRLRRGSYLVAVRALDAAGNVQRPRSRRTLLRRRVR